MGILEKIKAYKLESFDVFSSENALELKVFFGNYYEIFKKAYERFINVERNERYEYSILGDLISIIEKKIDIYDFSPDNLDKIDDTILATIIDDDKNQAAKLIQAFKQPGIKATLKCFTMATNSDGHVFVYESLKTAGNQIGVFYTVLRGMTDASEEFRKYIIPKIIEHQFYRYKSVVESVSMGYDIGYPIDNAKDFVTTMLDILSGNFQKYLDTEDAKTAYMILILLRRVDGIVYENFFDKMLNSPLKMQRFLAFFYMSQRRKDN